MKFGKLMTMKGASSAALCAVLFAALIAAGCSTGNEPGGTTPGTPTADELAGKLLILQAYGTGATGTAASHSFVELYNTTNSAVNLNGYSLYYADGSSSNSNGTRPLADGDAPWTRIDLNGKSIPAKSSFLILGAVKTAAGTAGLDLTAYTADVSAADMLLNNRAFKVALIKSSNALTEVNPFDTGNGVTVNGYVDMVGARNTAGTDDIKGFEGAPTRNSASAGVRRTSLVDTDDNSADFGEARYNEMSAEDIALYKPRNAANGTWDPFEEPEPKETPKEIDPNDAIQAGAVDALAKQLLILQAYGSSNNAAGVNRSFVELYNTTANAINLSGITLWYADGIRGTGVTQDGEWNSLALTGSIPAGGSFLIAGNTENTTGRYQMPDDYADITNADFTLGNRSFKVALIRNNKILTAQNPFNMDGNGAKAAGYIDMVGSANDLTASNPDNIFGYETAPTRNSASEAVRRSSLVDTDNNSVDFVAARYASGGLSDDEVELRKPRNSSAGSWAPFGGETPPEQKEPIDPSDAIQAGAVDSLAGQLLILQAYGSSSDASGISHSFVELYNTTNEVINLSGITLWYADGIRGTGITEDDEWNSLALNGTIPAETSFLILGPKQNTTGRHQITENSGDINDATFTLSNRAFKAALIRNNKTLTVQNPFTMDGAGIAAGYIDMVGAANDLTASNPDNIFGYETTPARNSASVSVRRSSLVDTDNNSVDFASIDYRAWSASNPDRTTDEQLAIYRPKNLAFGAWNPLTGATLVEQDPEPEPEPGSITINFSIPNETIDLTSNLTSLKWGQELTVSVSDASVIWYLDGTIQTETGSTLTVQISDLTVGNHTVTAIVTRGTTPSSNTLHFTVAR